MTDHIVDITEMILARMNIACEVLFWIKGTPEEWRVKEC